MQRFPQVLLATAVLFPALAQADSAMLAPWDQFTTYDKESRLKSCTNTRDTAPDGSEMVTCLEFVCHADRGLSLVLQIKGLPAEGAWPASLAVDETAQAGMVFAMGPDGMPVAALDLGPMAPVFAAMPAGKALRLAVDQPFLSGLAGLAAYPLDGAATAVPEFLAACPLSNPAAAPAAAEPASAPAAEATPPAALPSFSFTEEAAPAAVAPALPSFTIEDTVVATPASAPPGVIPGMPVTFTPDPAAAPLTPAEDAARFAALPMAALPDDTAESLVQALMTGQQTDFAARFGAVPEITADLVVFTDGRLILSAVLCAPGGSGDAGCETWTMTTLGGGAPFSPSAKGLPSDRPLWIDLHAPGRDGWPDLMQQDATGAWLRLGWAGTGYF